MTCLCRVLSFKKKSEGGCAGPVLQAVRAKSMRQDIGGALILYPHNIRTAESRLQDVPSIQITDIVLALYSYYDGKAMPFRYNMLDKDDDVPELLVEALQNTSVMFPPRLKPLRQFLFEGPDGTDSGRFLTEDDDSIFHKSGGILLLSSTVITGGAAAFFYPGVATRIAEGFGEDIYAAFVSSDDVLIHPASRANPEAILQAIAEVRRISTDEDAPLSNFVFCYRKDSKELGVIQCGDFIETPLVM